MSNTHLGDGEQARIKRQQAIGEIRYRLFDTMLGWLTPGSLIDLGAGHGAFSIRAAQAGWKVTAVDARTVRFPDDPSVNWVHEDVRETSLDGYDVIANLGLFYHLTLEDQLSLLDRAAGTPMILDTHFATKDQTSYGLSGLVNQGGYRGRLYSEERIQHEPTASWGNLSSFWPTPRALYRMLNGRGWEVFTATPHYQESRAFFFCIPR
jgi:hypothetical protein